MTKHLETGAKKRSKRGMKTLRVKEVVANCNVVLKNKLERTRLDNHNMQISDYLFVDLRQKLRLSSYALKCEDQCIDLGIIYADNDEIISSSRVSIPRETWLHSRIPTSRSSRRRSKKR